MAVLTAILNTLVVIMSLFLICLVLIQRGRGGGLAGAFGGTGGSSAFGTKAGDTFTRVTIVSASIWILMTMLLVVLMNRQKSSVFDEGPSPTSSAAPGSASTTPSPTGAVPPVPAPIDGAAPSAESAPTPAPVDRAPAIPETSTFPLTPGNAPPPKPE